MNTIIIDLNTDDTYIKLLTRLGYEIIYSLDESETATEESLIELLLD